MPITLPTESSLDVLRGQRVVLAIIGSLGDLHPTLALGRGLARHGARVVVASSPLHGERVRAAGLEFSPLGPDFTEGHARDLMQRVLHERDGARVLIQEIMMPMLRQTYAELDRLCRDDDLLVSGEVVYAAPILAEQRHLAWASVTLSPMPLLSVFDPPLLPQAPWLYRLRWLGPYFHRLIFGIGRLWSRRWCREVYALRRELGLPPGRNPLFDAKHSPDLALAMFSPLLAGPQPDWPDSALTTGFARLDDEPTLPAELETFLADGPPPVVFTLGSSAVLSPGAFFRESVEAVRRAGTRAVLLCGENPELPDLPEGVLALPYAPHAPLFRRAAVVVHSAGIGTLARNLEAGVPMLMVAQANDQPDNAVRAARLGVGEVLTREAYRADRVAACLQRLRDDPGVLAQCRRVAAGLVREDGVARACEALAGYLACRADHCPSVMATGGSSATRPPP